MTVEATKQRAKKIPPGSVKLQFAGELILAKRPDLSLSGLFQRFEQMFEHLANVEKRERLINYKMLNALMLSSHAKKATSVDEKRKLFELKNQLFIEMASNKDLRRTMDFRYLISKQVRVTQYCEECEKKGEESGMKRHEWKYCPKCKVDRDFFNILSMQHNFKDGFFRIFLSNEHIARIPDFRKPRVGKLNQVEEEGTFKKFHYNARNLDAFELQSVLTMHSKLVGK